MPILAGPISERAPSDEGFPSSPSRPSSRQKFAGLYFVTVGPSERNHRRLHGRRQLLFHSSAPATGNGQPLFQEERRHPFAGYRPTPFTFHHFNMPPESITTGPQTQIDMIERVAKKVDPRIFEQATEFFAVFENAIRFPTRRSDCCSSAILNIDDYDVCSRCMKTCCEQES